MRASEKTELKECGRCSQCVFERCRQLHATDDCGAPKKEEERTQVRSESHKTNPLLFSYYTPRPAAPAARQQSSPPSQTRSTEKSPNSIIGNPRNPILRLMYGIIIIHFFEKNPRFFTRLLRKRREINIDRNHDQPQCARDSASSERDMSELQPSHLLLLALIRISII